MEMEYPLNYAEIDPRFIEDFLGRAENLFVITVVFAFMGLAVVISLNTVKRDFGEITREPAWKKIPNAMAGELFSIFALVFMLHRAMQIRVAVICGLVALFLSVSSWYLNRYGIRFSRRKNTVESENLEASPTHPPKKVSENPVFAYTLSILSTLAICAFGFYAVISIVFNVIIINIQIQGFPDESLLEVLRLWDILITAVASISVIVFGSRLLIEMTTEIKETSNRAVAKVKKRLMR